MVGTALLQQAHAVFCLGTDTRQPGLDDVVLHAFSTARMRGPLPNAEVAFCRLLDLVQPVVDVVRRSAHACTQASHCLQTGGVYAWSVAVHGLLHFIAQIQNIFPFGVRHEYAFKG